MEVPTPKQVGANKKAKAVSRAMHRKAVRSKDRIQIKHEKLAAQEKMKAPKNAKKSKVLSRKIAPYQVYDVRFDAGRSNSSTTNLTSNTLSEIKITEPEFYEPYVPIAAYCVLEAYRNGFNTIDQNTNAAFSAYRQIFRVLHAYTSNTFSQLPFKIPRWLADYGAAIAPKTITTKAGAFDFSWITNGIDNYGPPAIVPCNQALGYETLIGYQPSASEINDFPVAVVSTIPPSEDEGAFNSLVAFMAQKGFKAWELVQPGDHSSRFARDASAFSQRIVTQGNTIFDGGAEYVAANELPITCMALTCAKNSGTTTFDGIRSTHCAAAFAGTTALFPFLATNCHGQKGLFTRTAPVAAPVDFNEFVEVLACAVSKVQTLAAASGTWQGDLLSLQCPISLQEMKLLLRDSIMRQFSTSQFYGSTYSHNVPSNSSDRVFQPFQAGVTTSPTVGSYEFFLPLELVENIRALGMVESQQGKKVVIYFPVLGQMNGDEVLQSSFTYTRERDDSPPEITPSFASVSFGATSKGGQRLFEKDGSPIVVAETQIDMIDGATGTSWLFINDTKQLGKLAGLWNGWFMQLAAHWQKPTAFTVDAGLSVMRCVGTSRFVVPQTVSVVDTKKRIETRIYSERARRHMNVSPTYNEWNSVAVCSSGVLFDYVMPILSKWVLPAYYATSGGPPGAATVTYVKVQGRTHQPFAAVAASSVGVPLTDYHNQYADSITKGVLSEDSDFVKSLEDMGKHGRAGILSMLAGFLQGPLNSIAPGLGDTAKMIGDVIPV